MCICVSICFYCLRITVFCSSDCAACWLLCWNCMYHVWCWYWKLSWCLWQPYEICFAWKSVVKCWILLLHNCCWGQIKISIFDHRLYPNYASIIFHTPDSIFMQDFKLAFASAIYTLSTKNTFLEKSRNYISDQRE